MEAQRVRTPSLIQSTDPLLPPPVQSVAAKIFRTANAPRTAPDATETLVAQALLDLENNVPDLKAELRPLQISAAREVDVKGGKKAIVVFVPVPQVKAFHKIQGRLTRELEKKFSDRHVVFIGQRRMMRKPTRGSRVKQQRPRSRTLKEVHEKVSPPCGLPTIPTSLLTAFPHCDRSLRTSSSPPYVFPRFFPSHPCLLRAQLFPHHPLCCLMTPDDSRMKARTYRRWQAGASDVKPRC